MAEIRFLRVLLGYRMTDLKRTEDSRGEIEVSDINTTISMSKEMAVTYGHNNTESWSCCISVNRRAEDVKDVR
jgi:hypothetical protein